VEPCSVFRPTLWRTCRVLANRRRLQIFHFLIQQPDRTVSEVARRLDLPPSVASESLRLLESRSLLTARRFGRYVKYRIAATSPITPYSRLPTALKATFQAHRSSKASDAIFHLVTAFTHPSRIEIFRALRNGPRSLRQLQMVTRISVRALYRHLEKLDDRGFIEYSDGLYSVVRRSCALHRELTRLAGR
jgi:DNA-binding transcriptional ArsR family regulator